MSGADPYEGDAGLALRRAERCVERKTASLVMAHECKWWQFAKRRWHRVCASEHGADARHWLTLSATLDGDV